MGPGRRVRTVRERRGTGLSSSSSSSAIPVADCDVDSERTDGRSEPSPDHFLCLLDSDDVMHPHRIAEQASVLLQLPSPSRRSTLLGCTFDRRPKDATWHYTHWANELLTDERRSLERYREVTVLQPTWMFTRGRFWELGGYVQSNQILAATDANGADNADADDGNAPYRLVHPKYDTPQMLRLAKDLRFFHAHLSHPHRLHDDRRRPVPGRLGLVRTTPPLLTIHSGPSVPILLPPIIQTPPPPPPLSLIAVAVPQLLPLPPAEKGSRYGEPSATAKTSTNSSPPPPRPTYAASST